MVVAEVQSNSVSFPILLRQSAANTDPKSLFLHLKARMSLHFLINRAFCHPRDFLSPKKPAARGPLHLPAYHLRGWVCLWTAGPCGRLC